MTADSMTEDPLSTSVDGPVATLWLNRPAKRNAVTYEMWQEMPEVLSELEQLDIRVLVVRGRGEHFCAGADITGIGARLADAGDPDGYRAANARAEEALARFARPTIAMIDGSCVGGGWQIAAACDLRIASTSLQLGITPAKLGITYPRGAVARTVGLVGPAATKRLLFTAELIGADEALRLGFVDQLVAPDALEAHVDSLCRTIGSRSLLTQLASKELIGAILDADPAIDEVVDRYERIARDGADVDEGLRAFAERREPAFGWHPGQPA